MSEVGECVGEFADLLDEAQQGSSVLLPVAGQILGQGELDTAQLDGHLETVGVQVVPVLHAAWTEKMSDSAANI